MSRFSRLQGGGFFLVCASLFAVVGTSLLVATNPTLNASTRVAAAAGSSPCQFRSAPQPASVALCETFDQPAQPPSIGRSPALSSLWGVSRQLGGTNFGQGQDNATSPTIMQKCGQSVPVQPPDDVAICNGQLVEAQTDQHGVTSLAMYAKQPFDIAGRTGTIAFDVSNDGHGTHRAWPELWYTDQPVPAPFVHFSPAQSVPRNGFGVRFAGYCQGGQLDCRALCPNQPTNVAVTGVDSAVVVNNYASNDSFMDVGTGTISVKRVGCVKASSGPGDMNHFELRVSQNEIDVFGTDAGATSGPMTELAVITNMSLSLTRGLVWMEDVHYNGDKDGIDQGTHTFTWDNFGFDGPVLPRDLAFDVLDHLAPVGGLLNLGWRVSPGDPAPLALNVAGVYNIANAAAGLLTFNVFPYNPVTISYRLNNGAWHDQPWPFGACYTQNNFVLCGEKSMAVPVPLSEVQSGTNTIQFKSSDATSISNVDLVLAGAAGPTPPPTTTTAPAPTTTTAAAPTTTAQPSTTTSLPATRTLGSTTIGPLVDTGDMNALHGTRVVTDGAGGKVVSVSAYVDAVDAAPNNQYQVGIYTTGSDGNPNTLVASSTSGTLTPFHWNTLAITATLLPNTSYWLEYNTNGNNNLHFRSAPSFGTWPASAAGYQSKAYSIYAVLG